MTHPIHSVKSYAYLGGYKLRVNFEDGVERVINFEPILAGELYGPLRDLDLFRQVTVDPEVHTLVWPNGADFNPATLHDWPQHEAAFREMARRWSTPVAP